MMECPPKLDPFLYENGMKNRTLMQRCMISGTLRYGRSVEYYEEDSRGDVSFHEYFSSTTTSCY